MTKSRQISDLLDGLEIDGDLSFGDNNKAIFGAGPDLEIYHDGSNSYVKDVGTGNLWIGGTNVHLGNAAASEFYIQTITNGAVTLYHDNSAKLATTNQGINVTGLTETDTINSSGLITTSAMNVNHSNGAKFRQYSMNAGSGGGAWLLGKIEHGGNADGGVSGKLCFAHDYGSTTDSPNIYFTFQQRLGVARGHWWYENTDDDAGSDNVSVKLIDDGSGGMFVWVVASDYVNCSVEASWRQVSESYLSDSGTLSAGTITTGTTLLDTANDPTAEMHIGKLFAHNNIDVTGMVTAEGLTISDDYPQIIFTDTNNNPDWTLIGANGRIGFYDATNAVEVATINSTGIDVTGTVTADGLTVANTGIPTITIQDQDGTNQRTFFRQSAATTIITSQNGTSYGEFLLSAYNGTNTLNRLKVFSGGDISFYEDTGVDVKLTWDASAESLNFADNSKAVFGAGSDLQIYHDGSNTGIQNSTGELFIYGGSDQIRIRAENSEESIVANPNGSVDLYHNGSEKLATTSTGVDVTGNVKLDAQNASIQLKSGATGSEGLIKWTFNTDNTVYAKAGIAYNTRATDGFLLDVGYPITLDATTNIKFKISGSEEMRLEADGDLHVDGNVIAYSTTISDKRLKKDIAPIDNALWKVSQLNGCTFTYLKDDRKSAGLIAQDLEKVLPSAVIEDEAVFHGEEGETYKTVQYDQVIGLLVEAVKELTAKVEELENASTK